MPAPVSFRKSLLFCSSNIFFPFFFKCLTRTSRLTAGFQHTEGIASHCQTRSVKPEILTILCSKPIPFSLNSGVLIQKTCVLCGIPWRPLRFKILSLQMAAGIKILTAKDAKDSAKNAKEAGGEIRTFGPCSSFGLRGIHFVYPAPGCTHVCVTVASESSWSVCRKKAP